MPAQNAYQPTMLRPGEVARRNKSVYGPPQPDEENDNPVPQYSDPQGQSITVSPTPYSPPNGGNEEMSTDPYREQLVNQLNKNATFEPKPLHGVGGFFGKLLPNLGRRMQGYGEQDAGMERADLLAKIVALNRQAALDESAQRNQGIDNDYKVAQTKHLGETPADKEIHSYTGADNKVHTIYQKSDSSTYEKVSDSAVQPDTANPRTPVPGTDIPFPKDVADQKVDLVKKETVAREEGKPDKPPLSSADRVKVAGKLTTVSLARQQLNKVKENYAKIKGTMSAGAGQGWIPTPSGQAYDAAVASLRPTFIGLTRTPGIGAMSDFETRLSLAPLPDRSGGKYETTMQEQIDNLDTLITALENGYKEIGGNGTGDNNPPPGPGVTPPPGMKLQQNPRTKQYRWAPQ